MNPLDELFKEMNLEHEALVKRSLELHDSAKRTLHIVQNADSVLRDLDKAFEDKISLNSKDIAFLFVAIGLQLARQHFIPQLTNSSQRPNDKDAADKTCGHDKEHSDRSHRYYNPSLEQIISNPVPFDATYGSNGALKGGGKFGHRGKTLGHDPLIGVVVGTANIATSTLTTTDLQSYHITTKDKKDYFKSKADTIKIFEKSADKLLYQGKDGKLKMATSLIKEIIHLNSDVNSKNSLPLPIISIFDPKLASLLAEYGFDMANFIWVTKHAIYTNYINMIISMVHCSFYDDSMDIDLYQVKTRKIVNYSNVVASSKSLVSTFVTEDFTKLDVGGLLITIFTLIKNEKFIRKVKEEFVFGSFEKMIMDA